MSFESLLAAFEQAAATRDIPRFAALFTLDAFYHDGFFGPHRGREAIASMLERFHVGGERFAWQFFEPVANEAANAEGHGSIGYARYCFSYVSKEPESAGQLIVFEGMARFRLEGGPENVLIADYDEVFDRGMAFVQLGYAGERVVKLLKRYAQGWRTSPAVQAHLAWRNLVAPTAPGGVTEPAGPAAPSGPEAGPRGP